MMQRMGKAARRQQKDEIQQHFDKNERLQKHDWQQQCAINIFVM